MSIASATAGNAVQCPCMCHIQGCIGYTGQCTCRCWKPSTTFIFPFPNHEIDSLRSQINSQEHTINHTQEGIEKCFEWLERIDPPRFAPNKTIPNIFEFIAVDAKRRDDIRHAKNALYEFYCWVLDNIQDNRERSIGIERLEECAMWLNKAISRRKGNGT